MVFDFDGFIICIILSHVLFHKGQ